MTWSDFKFDEFIDDNGRDFSGSRMPGVPEYFAYLGLRYQNNEGLKTLDDGFDRGSNRSAIWLLLPAVRDACNDVTSSPETYFSLYLPIGCQGHSKAENCIHLWPFYNTKAGHSASFNWMPGADISKDLGS